MLPVLNRVEMRGLAGDRDQSGNPNELATIPDASTSEIWSGAMRRLLAIQEYQAKFNAAYPGTPRHRTWVPARRERDCRVRDPGVHAHATRRSTASSPARSAR